MSFNKLTVLWAVLLGCVMVPKSAQAGVMLSLQSQGAVDLQNLSVGQKFTVEVVLSGIQAAEELNYLGGTVTFDSNFVGSASNIVPGAIIPDGTGFAGFGTAGLADGNYEVFFATSGLPIASNGVLYSFSVTTQQAGSGSFGFDISSLAARDQSDLEIPIDAGIALPYSIQSDPSVVPEPSSWLVLGIACLVTGLIRRSRVLIAI